MNRGRPFAALRRMVEWQIASRLLGEAVAMPFIDDTRLLVRRGMHGATGNVYTGLHEFEDMAFVLHVLRPGELCVDVGANVGAYTVLAAGAAGARVLAFEPSAQAYAALQDNIRLNGLEPLVETRREAVGAEPGELRFTLGLDTVNHVVAPDDVARSTSTSVPVTTLDLALAGREATILKVDVEGFESEVLRGASALLASPALLGIVMELNGSGSRYGHSDDGLAAAVSDAGFRACRYDPIARALVPAASIMNGAASGGRSSGSGNTLFVRHADTVAARLRAAPRRRVMGREI